jgi:hypothetical protein
MVPNIVGFAIDTPAEPVLVLAEGRLNFRHQRCLCYGYSIYNPHITYPFHYY